MNLPTGPSTVPLARDLGARIETTNVIVREGTTTHLSFAPPTEAKTP